MVHAPPATPQQPKHHVQTDIPPELQEKTGFTDKTKKGLSDKTKED